MKAEREKPDQLLHLVFGGELESLDKVRFRDLDALDIVGIYPNYAAGLCRLEGKGADDGGQRAMRYFIVHLHRLLEPERTMAIADQKPSASAASPSTLCSADHSRWPVFVRLARECVLPNWRYLAISVVAMVVIGGDRRRACRSCCRRSPTTCSSARTRGYAFRPACRAGRRGAELRAAQRLGLDRRGGMRSERRSWPTCAMRMFDTIAAADLAWMQRTHSGRFVSAFQKDVRRSIERRRPA